MSSASEAPPATTELTAEQQMQAYHAQLAAAAAAMPGAMPGTLPDGRPIQVRPCKYYPNCAKMDDPEHNAMYSHNTVVKKPPRPATAAGGAASALGAAGLAKPAPMQLCGFGEHCKRCGDEDHLDKYVHSCKFGSRCKKVDDPIHLKRFIHVLPGATPPVPTFTPTPRGPRHTAALPYSSYPAYPPPYPYPYGLPPLPSSYSPSPSPFPSSSHHSRAAAASYHPYASDRAGSSYASREKDEWANVAATLAGYGQAAYGDLRATADYSAYTAAYNSLAADAQYAL